jgi:hypothetical protein
VTAVFVRVHVLFSEETSTSSHSAVIEDSCLLGCDTVLSECFPNIGGMYFLKC